MLIQGIAKVAKRLDLLFYVGADASLDGVEVENAVARLKQQTAAHTTVELCRRARIVTDQSRGAYLKRVLLPGCLSIHRQPAFASFCGPLQVDAMRQALARRPDLVLVHDFRTMAALLRCDGPWPNVVLDVDNIEHRLSARHLLRTPSWPMQRLQLAWLPATLMGELRGYRRVQRLFVCSDVDRRYLEHLNVRHARTIPNAVDVPPTVPRGAGPPRLLYVGRLSYKPNATAVEHLMSDIWPRVLAGVPDAELWIAGTGDKEVRGSDRPPAGVRFLGFVKDLSALYADVRVVATPIRVGGGTRLKLLEAAAHGKAIVSTTLGAEGLDLRPEKDIILRDSPADFADACIELLRRESFAASLGLSARSRVRTAYSRPAVVDAIASELSNVARYGKPS
jgi:glycosyltransferase involved in cell wall biosynthesis